jgi:hypothetical protein
VETCKQQSWKDLQIHSLQIRDRLSAIQLRIIRRKENRHELGHVPQLFVMLLWHRFRLGGDFSHIRNDPRTGSHLKAIGVPLPHPLCPSPHRGCPILCGSHNPPTYPADCAAKGGYTRFQPLTHESSPRGGYTNFQPSHFERSIKFWHAQRTAQVLWRWRPPFHHL